MSDLPKSRKWRVGFFVHHQGSGHAKRCQAIIEHLEDCEVTIFSASEEHFDEFPPNVRFVKLPDMIGAEARVGDTEAQRTPELMHCVPLGVTESRMVFGTIAEWMKAEDPHLMFIDVSAELALLSRIMGVPAVKVHMHGDRSDPGHVTAYQACCGLLAPFNKDLEDPKYPGAFRAKTFYSGGLCTTGSPPLSKEDARTKLGLPMDRELIVAINGAGGKGLSYASLTLGARARQEAYWISIGREFREGHETDFPNLLSLGWVENGQDFIAAADVVIASGGDNTVTEIARMGRPFICIPEWRYFNEQVKKAEMFEQFGAAVTAQHWPGTLGEWNDLVEKAYGLSVAKQSELFDENAARKSADFLRETMNRLWSEGASER